MQSASRVTELTRTVLSELRARLDLSSFIVFTTDAPWVGSLEEAGQGGSVRTQCSSRNLIDLNTSSVPVFKLLTRPLESTTCW
jgi:hypothetical protein